MNLTQDWMERLAVAFKVEPQELISDPPLKRPIYVDGIIEEDGRVGLDGSENYAIEFEVDLGTHAPNASLWYLTEKEMFPPAIQDGDLLRFTHFAEISYEEFVGRICMVYFKDRSIPIVGVLSRGSIKGLFNITKPDAKLVKDVDPEYISVLTMCLAYPKYTYDEDGVPSLS